MKKLFAILAFVLVLCVVAGQYLYSQYQTFVSAPLIATQQLYRVVPGASLTQVVRDLKEQGITIDPFWLKWLSRLEPELTQLKVGTYQLESGWTVRQVLSQLSSGKEHQFKLTFIEGSRYQDWLVSLANARGVTQTLSKADELTLLKAWQLPHPKLEGLLLPETYHYSDGTKDVEILARAQRALSKELDTLWASRQPKLPLKSPYEALILASIIEKETALDSERTTIASVFINRLRKGMRLQTDPTVIYGMGDAFDGDIRRRDLRQPTPYNTYVIKGLPPTPIAMVSVASIKAALNPADTPYYYFVADGSGGHYFSKTLREHNRAVRKYILNK